MYKTFSIKCDTQHPINMRSNCYCYLVSTFQQCYDGGMISTDSFGNSTVTELKRGGGVTVFQNKQRLLAR